MAKVGVVVGGALAWTFIAPPGQAQTPPPSVAERFAVSVHARTTQASALAEQAAWLSLTLPLDRLASPRPAFLDATVPSAPSAPSVPPNPPAAAPSETARADAAAPRDAAP